MTTRMKYMRLFLIIRNSLFFFCYFFFLILFICVTFVASHRSWVVCHMSLERPDFKLVIFLTASSIWNWRGSCNFVLSREVLRCRRSQSIGSKSAFCLDSLCIIVILYILEDCITGLGFPRAGGMGKKIWLGEKLILNYNKSLWLAKMKSFLATFTTGWVSRSNL